MKKIQLVSAIVALCVMVIISLNVPTVFAEDNGYRNENSGSANQSSWGLGGGLLIPTRNGGAVIVGGNYSRTHADINMSQSVDGTYGYGPYGGYYGGTLIGGGYGSRMIIRFDPPCYAGLHGIPAFYASNYGRDYHVYEVRGGVRIWDVLVPCGAGLLVNLPRGLHDIQTDGVGGAPDGGFQVNPYGVGSPWKFVSGLQDPVAVAVVWNQMGAPAAPFLVLDRPY